MPHRTQSRNKITPTGRQKRPTVRLYGGGLNRPDRTNERPPRLAAFSAFIGIGFICNLLRSINLQYSLFHAYICRKLNFGGKSMNTMYLYFAYGSNMNPARMAKRCPGAIDLGGAVLRNHRVVERLYADIDFEEGTDMQGVLYVITEEHLRKLDRFEGYPSVYRRIWVDVEFEDCVYQAVTYEMAWQTKVARDRIKYPEEYRLLCSSGARVHNIKNNFTKKRKATK